MFIKKKTAYEMRNSDCSSDVCSSDLLNLYVHTFSIIGNLFSKQTKSRRGENRGVLISFENVFSFFLKVTISNHNQSFFFLSFSSLFSCILLYLSFFLYRKSVV